MKLNSEIDSPCSSWAALLSALPLRRNSRRRHHLDDFRKQKPVKPPAKSLRDRMCEQAKQRQAGRKKYTLAKESGQRSAGKILATILHHISRNPRHQRISQQNPSSSTEQLRQAAHAGGIENRHAHRSFCEIQRQCCEATLAAKQ